MGWSYAGLGVIGWGTVIVVWLLSAWPSLFIIQTAPVRGAVGAIGGFFFIYFIAMMISSWLLDEDTETEPTGESA